MTCLLAGCGKQAYIDSGDKDSLYPYSWRVNEDWSVTFKVDGDWDEECCWKPEYDEELLSCESGKKGNTFTVKSLADRGTGFSLCLYRGEECEYVLQFYLQGDSLGGVSVLDNGHKEIMKEGHYDYTVDKTGRVLLHIDTQYFWEKRTVYPGLSVELLENGGEYLVYEIVAEPGAKGSVELYCDELPMLLEVSLSADSKGKAEVKDVQQRSDSALSEKTVSALWEQLGFTPLIGDKVEIINARLRCEDAYPFPCGDLKLKIDDAIYDYSVSMSDEWIADYYIRDDIDDHTGAVIPGEPAEIVEICGAEVSLYAGDGMTDAVWEDYGAAFALEGDCDRDTMIKALTALMGG